jgi:hypothetical protein
MRRLLLLPFVVLPLAGCSPVGSEGLCIDAVMAGGILFTWAPGEVQQTEYPVGPEFARTQRQRECNDQHLTKSEPWREGDASFAPGTVLYRYEGYPPSERLLINFYGTWRELQPIKNQQSSPSGER